MSTFILVLIDVHLTNNLCFFLNTFFEFTNTFFESREKLFEKLQEINSFLTNFVKKPIIIDYYPGKSQFTSI